MGLTTAAGLGQWTIGLKAEPVLRDLGMRGDIIKTMHRAFTERGQDRGIAVGFFFGRWRLLALLLLFRSRFGPKPRYSLYCTTTAAVL
jgi:hypothetical protein